MITDAIKQAVAVIGGAALCAQLTSSQLANAAFMIIVLLTCITVMGHILAKCWLANRKARKKKEAARGRADKTDTP